MRPAGQRSNATGVSDHSLARLGYTSPLATVRGSYALLQNTVCDRAGPTETISTGQPTSSLTALDIPTCTSWELVPFGKPRYVLLPALQRFVDWLHSSQVVRMTGEIFNPLAV